jgi:hypothetical protein
VAPEGRLHEPGYDFNDEVLGPAIIWLTTVAKLALRE